jgi:TolB protein
MASLQHTYNSMDPIDRKLFEIGLEQLEAGEYQGAIETFLDLQSRYPDNPEIATRLRQAKCLARFPFLRPLASLGDGWICKSPMNLAGSAVIGLTVLVGVVILIYRVVTPGGPETPVPPFPGLTETPTTVVIVTTESPKPPTDTPAPPPPPDTPMPITPTETPTVGLSPTFEPTETPTPAGDTPTAQSVTDTPTPQPVTDTPVPQSTLTGQIAFPVYNPKRGSYDIYLANADGSNRRELVEEASEPAISPDGSKIAFRSWNDSTLGLMVSNIDGTKPQRVSRGLEDACPYWALEELLVFHSTKEGPASRLYTAGTWKGANGLNNVQDLRRGMDPVHGQYPAWVPGGRIVYKYFERSGDFRGLYIMNSDGSNPVPITDHLGDTMPSVTPRGGDKVAFMSNRTGRWEVYVVNIDGSELRQLTNSGSYNSGLPSWSPDGNYIAFVSDRDNQWAIWVINYDGSGERKLFDLDSPLRWWERISWGP